MLRKSLRDCSQHGQAFTPYRKPRKLLHTQALSVLKMPWVGIGEWDKVAYTAYGVLNSFM